MKKALLVVAGLLCAASVSLNAADQPTKKTPLTPEQKLAKKEMVQKYDADKNGKLSPDEMKKISTEDREKYEKAGVLAKAVKKGQKKAQ